MATKAMTDHAPKEANQRALSPNQLLSKDLRKINQAIDNLACASAAANQPERAQSSSMVIHHPQPRIAESKPVDIINQRLANYLGATTSDALGRYDNRFCKKASNKRLDAPKDGPPPPYEGDFRIPILYDTIASLEFQKSKLIQTNRLLHVRNARNFSTLIAAKKAAEKSLKQQADIEFRLMQEKHHRQLLTLGVDCVDVGFDPASNSSGGSSNLNSPTTVGRILETTQKRIAANNAALETLRRDYSNLVVKQLEDLRIMQDKIDKLKMEKENGDVNVTALVWALVGLAAMWVMGLMLWWDI